MNSADASIRVMVVDDQSLIRQGLRALLELEPDITVVADAENGQVAMQKVETLHPGVVLLDLRMPVMDGIATTRAISQRFPTTRVLILTTFDDQEDIQAALQAGAAGYLLKDTPSEELAAAIRAVNKGYAHFGPGILPKVLTPQPEVRPQIPPGFADLTQREREVLKWLARGSTNREIAQQLYISEGTVKNHVTSLLTRLNLRDRTQAAILAQTLLPLLESED